MADDIPDDELQKLLNEGLSQNEIARRTNIPRSTLRRRLRTLTASLEDLGVPEQGIPYVNQGTQIPETATETEDDDLEEMRVWWREVAYPLLADNVSRPLPSRPRRLTQPVMSPPHGFSAPRQPLSACI